MQTQQVYSRDNRLYINSIERIYLRVNIVIMVLVVRHSCKNIIDYTDWVSVIEPPSSH